MAAIHASRRTDSQGTRLQFIPSAFAASAAMRFVMGIDEHMIMRNSPEENIRPKGKYFFFKFQ
ncbi:MAG: hypothetical protein ACOY90_14120 [Candidatus Zhuqueibacterota bacterium]